MLAAALALVAGMAYPACVDIVERHYALPRGVISAIIQVESGGNPRAVNRANRNGTVDYGLMQINSSHLPRLRGFGVNEGRLLSDECVNVAVGADILRSGLDDSGGALVPALARYNTGRGDSPIGLAYASKVLGAADAPGSWQAAVVPTVGKPAPYPVSPPRSPLLVAQRHGVFASGGGLLVASR